MTHALYILLTALVLAGFAWLGNRPPAITAGAAVLRYPLAMRLFGLLAGVGFVAVCAAAWLDIVNGTAAPGSLRTAFRGRRRIRWDEVASADSSRMNHWLRLRDRAGETLRISRFLRGHAAVWTALEGKVEPSIWQAAAGAYRQDRLF